MLVTLDRVKLAEVLLEAQCPRLEKCALHALEGHILDHHTTLSRALSSIYGNNRLGVFWSITAVSTEVLFLVAAIHPLRKFTKFTCIIVEVNL